MATNPGDDLDSILADTVALAGDWECNGPWAVDRIGRVAEAGVGWILQLGDFRVWPGDLGKRYLTGVEKALKRHGVRLLVTPGNHEDWARLDSRWANPKARDASGRRLVLRLTDHVAVLPPGHRFAVTTSSEVTRSFVSLGGAPSVDFPWCRRGVDWWPEEAITAEEVAQVVAEGHADVMLAHDSPDGGSDAVERVLASNPLGLPDESLVYAAQGRALMNEAFSGVLPRLFAHGHYHVFGDTTRDHALSGTGRVDAGHPTGRTRFLSLPNDVRPENTVLLDVATLSTSTLSGQVF